MFLILTLNLFSMLTIALIDKHPILRLGLSFCLKKHFIEVIVKEGNDIIEYNELHPAAAPNLIIQGINENPKESNFHTVERIKGYHPKTPIIIYDENPMNFKKMPYLESGINGYVLKQNDVGELLACIDAVLNGKYYISPQLLEYLSQAFMKKKTIHNEKQNLLTKREQEVAKYLCEGMQTSSIASKTGRKSSTISTIKTKIFKKLGVKNTLELRDFME